jgi:hypothetical protein
MTASEAPFDSRSAPHCYAQLGSAGTSSRSAMTGSASRSGRSSARLRAVSLAGGSDGLSPSSPAGSAMRRLCSSSPKTCRRSFRWVRTRLSLITILPQTASTISDFVTSRFGYCVRKRRIANGFGLKRSSPPFFQSRSSATSRRNGENESTAPWSVRQRGLEIHEHAELRENHGSFNVAGEQLYLSVD